VAALESTFQTEFDLLQAFVDKGRLGLIMSNAEAIDWHSIEQSLEQALAAPCRVYPVAPEYKKRLFAELTNEERSACGIKLPLVTTAATLEKF
jgi:hypothetical protein